jgi:hypothetical protein
MNEKDLIQFQSEYITLLEKVAKQQAVFLFNHGYMPDGHDVDEGTYLREKIRLAKNEPPKENK